MALDDAAVARAAAAWASSAPVDVEFYSALRGTAFGGVVEAAEDWVRFGMPARLVPDPFLDFHGLPADARRSWRQQDVDAVLRHLDDASAGPLEDRRGDDQLRRAMIEVAAKVANDEPDLPDPEPAQHDESLTSVVVVAPTLQPAARAVHRLVQESGDEVQVVVVDDGLPPHAALGLHARLLRDGVRGLRVAPGRQGPTALDVALSRVRGARVVLLAPHVLVRPGWLTPLLEELSDPEVQGAVPLVVDELDLIAGRGALRGHPPEDAASLAHALLPQGDHDLLVTRTGRSGSIEPADESCCAARLVPASRVTAVAQSRSRLPEPPASGAAERVRRWSIQLPSPPGFRGDRWGDTYFAEALARSLGRQGVDVVTRRRGAHAAGPIELDDVHLVLRGLHRGVPTPGKVNVLWVISHPEDVAPNELDGYDVVCAASTVWSRELSGRSGRPVFPLLQASEFEAVSKPRGLPTVVFVGNNDARRDRPMVHAALAAGLPLAVYGRGWEGLPEGVWRGAHVDNRRLGDLYGEHGIVLSDHWADMAELGFVANRVFDAVAAGARVISDPVAGLRDLFDARWVQVASTPQELRAAYDDLCATPTEEMPAVPAVSFDDRAATLLDLVEGVSPDGGSAP